MTSPVKDTSLLNADWTLPSFIEDETTEVPGDNSTSFTLKIGTTLQGQLTETDNHDWYKVTLVKDQTYSFAEVGTGKNIASLYDPYLNLIDASGKIVAFDDDNGPGTNASLTYKATYSGIYYLDATSAIDESGIYDTGQYGLSASLNDVPNNKPLYDVPMGAGAINAFDSWQPVSINTYNVSYGFRQSAASYEEPGSNIANFSQLSSAEMTSIRYILSLWSDVCNINFTEIKNTDGYTNNATILIGNYADSTDGVGAFAYFPDSLYADNTSADNQAGDLWLNTSGGISTDAIPIGSFSFSTIIHELGHAIGLSHPGDYNAGPGIDLTYASNAQFAQDSNQYSVMSYFDAHETGASVSGNDTSDVSTPLLFDIYEAQQLYGTNYRIRTYDNIYGFGSNSGDVYDFDINKTPLLCIWDAGGKDTLNCANYYQKETIDLIDGSYSSIGGSINNVSIALGAIIENAIGGTGENLIIGNSVNNYLTGGTNNDTIEGGGGNDTINSGAGDDSITGGAGDNLINCGDGYDCVFFSLNYADYTFNYSYTSPLSKSGLSLIVNGPDSSDTITNAELLKFNDNSYSVSNIINHQIPTFTKFISPIATINEDSTIAISFSKLISKSDAKDVDGKINGFVVSALNNGSLKIGTTLANAMPWDISSNNNIIDAQHIAFWTPDLNANNVNYSTKALNAFSVSAKDNNALLSDTPIQAQISVKAVNDAPILNTPKIITLIDTVYDDTFDNAFYKGITGGNLFATDVDSSKLTYSIKNGTGHNNTIIKTSAYGTLTVTKTTGEYTFKPNDKAIELLTSNKTTVFTVTVSDGLATPVSKQLIIDIKQEVLNGSNGTESKVNDSLVGSDNNEQFDSLAGNDIINSMGGNDTLIGGLGSDSLTGGLGSDLFKYKSTAESPKGHGFRDVITDFTPSEGDKIDLSSIDANTKSNGKQAFASQILTAFDGHAGEIIYSSSGILSGDTNGDSKPDFEIELIGSPLITSDCLILM